MAKTAHDLTDRVLHAPIGTVLVHKTEGSVWVLVAENIAGPRMLCIHHPAHPDVVGRSHTRADLVLLRVYSDQWRILGAVPGTPAAND